MPCKRSGGLGLERNAAHPGQQAGQLQPRVHTIVDAHVAEPHLLRMCTLCFKVHGLDLCFSMACLKP